MSTREERRKAEDEKRKRHEEARKAARILAGLYIEAYKKKKGKK